MRAAIRTILICVVLLLIGLTTCNAQSFYANRYKNGRVQQLNKKTVKQKIQRKVLYRNKRNQYNRMKS